MELLEGIYSRHSTRKFTSDLPSDDSIREIVEAGRRAPSGGNTQQTHFIVITNQNVIQELVKLVQEEYGKTEITEQTLPYLRNIIKLSKEGKFVFTYGAPVLILLASPTSYGNRYADTACAMQNMMLAANALELGSCWVNQVRWLNENPRMIAYLEQLGLQENEQVCASLVVGYPDLPMGLNRRHLDPKGYPVTYIK